MSAFKKPALRLALLPLLALLSLGGPGLASASSYVFRTSLPGAFQSFTPSTQTLLVPGVYTLPIPVGATSLSATLVGGGGGARLLVAGDGAEVFGSFDLSGLSQITVIVGGGGGGLNYGGGGGGGGYPGGGGGDDGTSNPEGGNGGVSYAAPSVTGTTFQLADNKGTGCTNTSGWGNAGGNGSVILNWR